MPDNFKISIIVPAFNAADTLKDCLKAVFASDFKDFEVIVVEDCSQDATAEIAHNFPVKIIKHALNRGAAASRNDGAEKAQGDILLFIDADVFIKKDTLDQIWEFFNQKQEITAIACTMSPKYCSETFGAKFISLRTYYYYRWIKNEVYRNYTIFQSQCGAIRTKAFKQLGGFNPSFKGAGIEEYEFGHRLSNVYRNVILQNIQFERRCKNFPQRLKTLLTRSATWAPVFIKRIKFESPGALATAQESLSAVFSFWGISCFLCSFLHYNLLIISLVMLFSQFLLEIKFLRYVYLKEGLFFTGRVYLAVHLMHLTIGIGFICGVLRMLLPDSTKKPLN